MYQYYDIKIVHLEVTAKCQASCPMCARNVHGGVDNPLLPITELSFADCVKIFPPQFVEQLDKMYMCGNFGDPIVSNHTFLILQYFRDNNPKISLSLNTNGSARKPEWWRNLARITNPGYVHFGIDGIDQKTHSKYRRGTDFDTIIENARAFIGSGGKAIWDFIVFKHNEHQIDEARKAANGLGFSDFQVKKSSRSQGDSVPVHNESGEVVDTIYFTKKSDLINQSILNLPKIKKQWGSIENYLKTCQIECKAKQSNEIYVSAEGLVFPCCWTAGRLYAWYDEPGQNQMKEFIDKWGGPNTFNAKKCSIQSIVESDAWQKGYPESWQQEGRLSVCANKCGTDLKPFDDQFK